MSIFRNSNESAYVGGRKHWSDVIKNSGDGNYLIWRQPEEDFNTNSTLIVMPGEEAIFVNGGRIEEAFSEGTYKLSTENYPFISRLHNAFTGGISTFNCVVYFVRKAISKELLWGSDSPIQVRDKKWGVLTYAKARGSYKIRIEDSVLFLRNVVGNNIQYQTKEDIFSYFEVELTSKIKSTVSSFLNYWPEELIGLDAYLLEISDQITPRITDTIFPYGLSCVSFALIALDIDTSKYEQFDRINIEQYEALRKTETGKQAKQIEAEGDAEAKRILAGADKDAAILRAEGFKQEKRLMGEGEAEAMNALGDNWAKMKAGEILHTVAQNPGAGGIAATGAGIGMGFAAGNVFASMADQMFAPMSGRSPSHSPYDNMYDSGRYEQVDEGNLSNRNDMSYRDKLRELKALLDEGLIEQKEYDETKKAILDAMKG